LFMVTPTKRSHELIESGNNNKIYYSMLIERGCEEDMAVPAPKAMSETKLILEIIAIAIIAVVITPIALAGSYRVPLDVMSFDDTTGSTSTSSLRLTSQVVTAWE